MNNRMIVFAGAALLIVGLFVPIIQLPMVGNVSIFADGTNLFAYVLLACAALAAFMASKEQTHDAIWPGGAAALLVIALFIDFQIRISRMKAELAQSAEGNPFGGLATGMMEAVQLQWGWIVLAAAVAALVYGAFKERKESDYTTTADGLAKIGSVALLVVGIGWLVYQSGVFQTDEATLSETASTGNDVASSLVSGGEETRANAEEERYIAENVEVYDLTASYRDSMFEGRVPGVDFKVKNNGDRSLDGVDVTVIFYDAEGNAIAEDTFYPVLVTSYDSDPPLRPGYIWQQERNQFYAAKSVPDEWESGKVTAKVTDIEFSPEN